MHRINQKKKKSYLLTYIIPSPKVHTPKKKRSKAKRIETASLAEISYKGEVGQFVARLYLGASQRTERQVCEHGKTSETYGAGGWVAFLIRI